MLYRAKTAFFLIICLSIFGQGARAGAPTPQELLDDAHRKSCGRSMAQIMGADYLLKSVDKVQEIAPGSITEQIGLVYEKRGQLILAHIPFASRINKALGLVKGKSDIFIVDVALPDGIEIPWAQYHDMLSRGEVGIGRAIEKSLNETFEHDVVAHVVGYVILSRTPLWYRIRNIFGETLAMGSNADARVLRGALGIELERVSGLLSRLDRQGDRDGILQTIRLLDIKLKEMENKLSSIKWENRTR